MRSEDRGQRTEGRGHNQRPFDYAQDRLGWRCLQPGQMFGSFTGSSIERQKAENESEDKRP
ncbi:MAG: hypothetical protein HY936_04005 [Nitrosomonadales bacterium]|nr:hypothetical protein [Nitrosomonadales bacterium]